MDLDFGDYCSIEQKRYGVPNEMFKYKVINAGRTNYWREVPVNAKYPNNTYGEMCETLRVICCGVVEEKVETFRIEDVRFAADGSFG